MDDALEYGPAIERANSRRASVRSLKESTILRTLLNAHSALKSGSPTALRGAATELRDLPRDVGHTADIDQTLRAVRGRLGLSTSAPRRNLDMAARRRRLAELAGKV